MSFFGRFFRNEQATKQVDPETYGAVTTILRGYYGLQKRLSSSIRAALSGNRPGSWASDHFTEAQQFTGWNYVCIDAIAQQAAGANVEVFGAPALQKQRAIRRLKSWSTNRLLRSHDMETPEGLEPLDDGHRLVRMMHRPNPATSGATFRYELVQQIRLTGTALIAKVRDLGENKPLHLYTLPTGLAHPERPNQKMPNGGWRIARTVANPDAQQFTELRGYAALAGKVLPAEDVAAIRSPHPLWRDDGLSALAAGALWTDASLQVDQTRFNQLKNGVNPSFVFGPGTNQGMPSDDEIDEALRIIGKKWGGPENAGRAMFVPTDKFQAMGTTPKDMAYDQGWDQYKLALMALHRVTPIAAGITEGGSYAALFAALKGFVMLTVQPLLNQIAEELTEQVAREFGEEYVVWMTAANVDDPAVLEQRLATDIAGGWITVDEARQLRGLPPVGPERGGDKLLSETKQPAEAPAADPLDALMAQTKQTEQLTGVTGMPADRQNGKAWNRLKRYSSNNGVYP